MSSFSDASSSDGHAFEQNQISKKLSDTKMDNERMLRNVNKETLLSSENSQTPKRNFEMCGVHSRSETTAKVQHTKNENEVTESLHTESYQAHGMRTPNMEINKAPTNETSSKVSVTAHSSTPDNKLLASINLILSEDRQDESIKNEQSNAKDNADLITKEVSEHAKSLNSTNQEQEISEKTSSTKPTDGHLQELAVKNETRIEDTFKTHSQSSLPDILSSLNETANAKLQVSDNSWKRQCDNLGLDRGSSKTKPFASQTNYTQSFPNSDALHNEMEMELKELQNLKVSQANQAIYKLAYDENVTDHSENSKSPSRSVSPRPVTAESQIPGSYLENEIVVYEADTDDDAGSEDVELIPHRYESESYLNKLQNKNVFENKLSLAVELLRTQEDIPYDAEFKRIVDDNNVEPSEKVIFDFKEDSSSPGNVCFMKNIANKLQSKGKNGHAIISQDQINPSRENSSDSAIFSDISFMENETHDFANDDVPEENDNKENTYERAGYRRRIRAQRRFSPLPFNPCFCCAIM